MANSVFPRAGIRGTHSVDRHERIRLGCSGPDYWKLYKEGKLQDTLASRSGVPALQKLIDERYPFNDTNITDQIRADEFLRELDGFEKSGNMPQLSVLTLTSDHTNGTRPGSPTPRAMVADDDLALGRIVEGVTKSRFWPSTLIFGGGRRCAERTRSRGWAPHGSAGHRSAHPARRGRFKFLRPLEHDPNHSGPLPDSAADALRGGSPAHDEYLQRRPPMPEPYKALQPGIALDEMNPPLKALQGRQLWAANSPSR